MDPSRRGSPNPATPTTRVLNTRGTTTINSRRKKTCPTGRAT
jgi:hypothetical protein